MVREISVLVYHSQLFPAHWGLWIPSAGNPTVGKVIHVTGDSFSGFGHELKRGYSTVNTDRKPDLFFLANVEDRHIVDTPVCGVDMIAVDTIAVDDIERIALAIPAPAKSLNRASGEPSRTKVKLLNCQTWLRELVVALVAAGIFPEAAITTLDGCPKN